MRSGKRAGVAIALLAAALALRGELQEWVQRIPAGALTAMFFRKVPMPDGAVAVRRNPSETRAALGDAILVKPAVANLYRLRAHEDELALDFAAAEADWRKYALRNRNRAEGYTALADYYHRREQGAKEVQALQSVAAAPTSALVSLGEQAPWRATERILSVVNVEALSPGLSSAALESWLGLHPEDQHAYQTAIEFYVGEKQFDRAQSTLDRYAKQFPADLVFQVRERAALALARGQVDRALDVYDTSFLPLWPAELSAAWFELLQAQEKGSDFTARSRKALLADAGDVNAMARLFQYAVFTRNGSEARRVLEQYRLSKEAAGRKWSADELWIVGQLFERLPDYNEAARSYYAMYSLAGVPDAAAARALAALANLLLTEAEQPIAFGSGDLSFYRDVAQADRSPGFLNGILSLLFNSASPRREYADQNLKSAAYFHRGAGAQLVDLLAQRFPQAEQLPALRAEVVQSYSTYADYEWVVRSGQEYLKAFPHAPRVQVAMLTCSALASLGRVDEEFAIYDALLKELSAQTQQVPLGEKVGADSPSAAEEQLPVPDTENDNDSPEAKGLEAVQPTAVAGAPPVGGARSPEYQQVLDRYLARLSSLQRPMDALRLYRREIDRNPNDPGLYRQFAAYLDHNQLGTQLIETYRKAMARFPNRNWYESLARWYLREKRKNDFAHLCREVTDIFSGSELERYFTRVVAGSDLDAHLSLQLNLYAHQRFPNDLVFVHRLLSSYAQKETQDNEAYAELLRIYWYYEGGLKRQYLTRLAASGTLAGEIDAVRKANPAMAQENWKQASIDNPAAVQFIAEAEAWRSHFEEAAPAFRAMAEARPGDRSATERGASAYRSLAAYFPEDTAIAVNLLDLAHRSDLRDRELLASEGDVFADRDQLARARPIWNSILKIEPGKSDSWLSAATVFWDYYLFDDALRVIADGRRKFADPTLFAYQAGAVYEGRRDYRGAIQQYAAGAAHGDNDSQNRLLSLARRDGTADMVDRVTEALAGDPGKSTAKARDLRVAVLEAQNRRKSLESFLAAALDGAQQLPAAAQIAAIARRDGFDAIEERATLKQVALTLDPIDKMRKQIELSRFYSGRGNAAKAEQTMDEVYRANPKILGVVRAAVDLEKQQKNPDRAIEILLAAATEARADLGKQFTLEAARTATDAADYRRARTILAGLLKTDPYQADYLAAEADTYSREKDDTGFSTFTLATIKSLQGAPLTASERADRIVALRRGLIPVLTRQGAFDRATDQYVEALNRFPEDDALAREAAQYAIAHQRLDQLLRFYRKTVQDAPRDYRWPIVLARVETVAADYPAAIADYSRAMGDRPDRADLPEACGTLEERLLRFDNAIQTFGKVYELTYHSPQWLERIAELQARMGRTDEAVKDLQTAIIGDGKESASNSFRIAQRLDDWNMVKEAVPFVERGQARSSEVDPIYYRVMTRARRWNQVFGSGDPDEEQIRETAQVVSEEYTPEEKVQVEKRVGNRIEWLPFAQQAGLAPLEARIRLHSLATDGTHLADFNALQMRRGLFQELGKEMEQLAVKEKADLLRTEEQNDAAAAYIAEGDRANALRVIGSLATQEDLPGTLRDWYLATLSKTEPDRLVEIARDSKYGPLRYGAVQYAIANDDAALAMRAVAARGASESKVWNRAFIGLTGLYFADATPAVSDAFRAALNSDPAIGDRVRAPADRTGQIAGGLWFYYGARYGGYLADLHRGASAEFLPASLEATPGNPEAYMQLAAFYEQNDAVRNALARYREVLQLNEDRGDAHDHIARILLKHGKRAEALGEWRAAIAIYEKLQSQGVAVPESFWAQSTETIGDIGSHGVFVDLQPALARWITDYAQRNAQYRLASLLTAALRAAIDARADTKWVLDIAVSYADDATFNAFALEERVTKEQRVELQRRRIEVTKKQLTAAYGDAERQLNNELDWRRVELVAKLVDAGKIQEAQAEWNQLSAQVHQQNPQQELLLAAATGTTDKILDSYRANPERAPAVETLLPIVALLRTDKFVDAALGVAEFAYQRELDNQKLDAANFLGLAGVMIERHRTADAVALLRRMNLISGEPFETFVPAAELLKQHGLNQEAIPFLRDRVRATPWDANARVQLALLLSGAEKEALLNRVIADPLAPYDQRAEAAEPSTPHSASEVAADSELAALAGGTAAPNSVEKPYWMAARVRAARGAASLRLLREASSIAPEDVGVRIAEVRAALADGRDNLALSLVQVANPGGGVRRGRMGRFVPQAWVAPDGTTLWEQSDLSAELKAKITEDLSQAAERVDDLALAINYEQAAGKYRTEGDFARLELLKKEQNRRVMNASRQPLIGPSIEQPSIVAPKLLAGRTP